MSQQGFINKWFDLQNKFVNISYKQFKFYKKILGTKCRVTRVLESSKYRTVFGPAFTSNALNDPEVVEFDYVILLNHNQMVDPKNRNIGEFEFYDNLIPGVINKSIRFKEYRVSKVINYELNHNLGYYPEVTCINSEGLRIKSAITHLSDLTCQLNFDEEFSGIILIDPYDKVEQSLILSNNLQEDQEFEIELLNGIYELVAFKDSSLVDISDKLTITYINKNKIKVKVPQSCLYKIYLTESKDSIYNELLVSESGTLVHSQKGMPNFKIYDENRALIKPELISGIPDTTHIEVDIVRSWMDLMELKLKCEPIYNDYLITFRNSIIEENFFRLKEGDLVTYSRANRSFQFKIIKEETFSVSEDVVYRYTLSGLHEVVINKNLK